MLAFAHILDKSELERAVAGASVNDFFYFFAVLIFLPLESISGVFYHLSSMFVPSSLGEGYQWVGFIGQSIVPFTDRIIIANKVRKKERNKELLLFVMWKLLSLNCLSYVFTKGAHK